MEYKFVPNRKICHFCSFVILRTCLRSCF